MKFKNRIFRTYTPSETRLSNRKDVISLKTLNESITHQQYENYDIADSVEIVS